MLMDLLKDRLNSQISQSAFRFITVDAYHSAIRFYQKNGFKFLKPSELTNQEKETVTMYYDLTQLL